MPDMFPQVSIQETFNSKMRDFGGFENQPHIAIALSGGSDSMALVRLAALWTKENQGKITALSFDHALRPESKKEVKIVQGWIQKLGISYVILRREEQFIPHSNIQEQARYWRYDALTHWCKKNHILHLLVGHNREDQIETCLMRKKRGSFIDGLAGIAEISFYNDTRILRPLLTISRKHITHFLRHLECEWIEDPSNQNTQFERVKIRNFLSQDEGVHGLQLLKEQIKYQAQRQRLENSTAHEMADCVTIYNQGYATLKIEKLLTLPQEIALRILSEVITTIAGKDRKQRFSSLENAYNQLIKGVKNALTLWGCKISVYKENLFVIREFAVIKSIPITKSFFCWDRRYHIEIDEKFFTQLCSLPYQFCLSPVGYGYVSKLLPKRVITTLPSLRIINTDGLEETLYIPHLNYYTKRFYAVFTENFDVKTAPLTSQFIPKKPLSLPFFNMPTIYVISS